MKKYLPTSYAAATLELLSQGYKHEEVSRALCTHLQKAKKLSLLPIIVRDIAEQSDAGTGVVVDVFTAHRLAEPGKREIMKLCKQLYKTAVTLRTYEDSSLVGGVVLKRGDEVIDYSVATLVSNLHTYIKQ